MNKRYQIIYADPPWKYGDKCHDGKQGTEFETGRYYKSLSTKQICELNVKEIMDDNCVCFLWVTMPMLEDGLKVMNAWGFKYKTVAFNWVKRTNSGKAVTNLGRYTMGSSELCLLGTKGNLVRVKKNVRQLVETVRENHSKKPDEVRNRIIDIFGSLLRIELFARQKAEGWDVWGNEVESDIIL